MRLLLTLVQNNHPLIQLSNADAGPQLNLFYNREVGAALTMNGTGRRTVLALLTGGLTGSSSTTPQAPRRSSRRSRALL